MGKIIFWKKKILLKNIFDLNMKYQHWRGLNTEHKIYPNQQHTFANLALSGVVIKCKCKKPWVIVVFHLIEPKLWEFSLLTLLNEFHTIWQDISNLLRRKKIRAWYWHKKLFIYSIMRWNLFQSKFNKPPICSTCLQLRSLTRNFC